MTRLVGAEATVELGENAVKTRRPKSYRHPELDRRLGEGRTDAEAEMLRRARRTGVNVPKVKEAEGRELTLERIEGEKLRDLEVSEYMERLGEQVSRLHNSGIVHGDLTTSNAIVREGEIFLIDFGLAARSSRTEDLAVDLHLLKQVLRSSHPGEAEESWEEFAGAYDFEGSDEVLSRLEDVEHRGRYK